MMTEALRDEKLWRQMPKLLDAVADQVKFKGETLDSFCGILVSIEYFRNKLLAWARKD
jgi:hypothetical protein